MGDSIEASSSGRSQAEIEVSLVLLSRYVNEQMRVFLGQVDEEKYHVNLSEAMFRAGAGVMIGLGFFMPEIAGVIISGL